MDNKSSEFTTTVICAYIYTTVKPAGLQFTSIYCMELEQIRHPLTGTPCKA